MPQHVSHADVVKKPHYVTYANVVANKPVFASRHLLKTVNQEKSEANPAVPTILITPPCPFQVSQSSSLRGKPIMVDEKPDLEHRTIRCAN
jgi:hypothetical protein